jgi:DUF1680 family protein
LGTFRTSPFGGRTYRDPAADRTNATEYRNGQEIGIDLLDGYASINREWDPGDTVELCLPMPARKVLCDPRAADNRGKAALQRGPVVYCVEGRDSRTPLDALFIGVETEFETRRRPDVLGGIVELRGRDFSAVPYYSWAHRGPGPMRVWLRNEGGACTP